MKKIHIRKIFISFLIILSIPLPFLFNSCSETNFGQRNDDKAENTTRVELDLQATHDFVEKIKSFTIKETVPVDFLFIIDASGSMRNERKHLSNRINIFIQKLNADNIDWRIAIQSTNGAYNNYNMTPLIWNESNFKKYVLKNQDSYSDRKKQEILEQTILSVKPFSEHQGIKSLINFLENKDRYPQNDLLRLDAHFISILISDNDESNGSPSLVQKFISRKVAILGNSKVFQFHSIVSPSQESCRNTTAKGRFYEMLSNTNDPINGILPGKILNICSLDYTTVLDGITESIKDLTRKIFLECSSVDVNDNGDFKDDIEIKPNPQVKFTLNQDKDKITFETHLNPGSYTINYSCARK